ncbi:MAG: non-heme iron oxygenase ferredoxin subunit [Acidimicrobiia bacterium]|nr:non-heme iron oxygenase ferredoxin subunit [Acidimicrobiia bacterium]MYC57902.1 non-heme iron oxygenase ferredoxin subunit [Acidimicrobiia bacterium]MYI29790.1 non-heme iron oxygenase ferredoxin subunit [Acidimicrobiia bacterium]
MSNSKDSLTNGNLIKGGLIKGGLTKGGLTNDKLRGNCNPRDNPSDQASKTNRVHLCQYQELGECEARRFDVVQDGFTYKVAVIRLGDDVYALGDTCSHANFSLSEGAVDAEDGTIECWKHGSLFSLTTGEALTLPATRPVPVYRVGVTDGEVWLELDG